METELDTDIAFYRSKTFAENTKKLYNCHKSSCIELCLIFGYRAVPVNHEVLCRYTAYLAKWLAVSSLKKYQAHALMASVTL